MALISTFSTSASPSAHRLDGWNSFLQAAFPGIVVNAARDIHGRSKTFLLGDITRAVTARIRMLRHATDADRERWGIDYVRETLARWEREEPEDQRRELLANADFAELVEAARESSS